MDKQETSTLDRDELLALAGQDIERGNLEEALRKLKAIVNEPDPLPEALAMIARVYAQLRLFERAQVFFERYLKTAPGALNETFQLGMVHHDSGRPTEALEVWDRVLKAMPTHPPALFYSGFALTQQGKLADAKRSLDILLHSAQPGNLYFNRAKELLASIESQAQAAAGRVKAGSDAGASTPNPYRMEH